MTSEVVLQEQAPKPIRNRNPLRNTLSVIAGLGILTIILGCSGITMPKEVFPTVTAATRNGQFFNTYEELNSAVVTLNGVNYRVTDNDHNDSGPIIPLQVGNTMKANSNNGVDGAFIIRQTSYPQDKETNNGEPLEDIIVICEDPMFTTAINQIDFIFPGTEPPSITMFDAYWRTYWGTGPYLAQALYFEPVDRTDVTQITAEDVPIEYLCTLIPVK